MNPGDGLPNFKIQIPLFAANSYLSSQKMPCFLWSLKVHYTDHKQMPLDPILTHTSLFTIKFNITPHLCTCCIYIFQKQIILKQICMWCIWKQKLLIR